MTDNPSNTRFNIPRDPRNPEDHLQTGYEGSVPTDYTIPSCEIEDVDVALHTLFDTTIGFRSAIVPGGEAGPSTITKPFVIFATGERFALTKKLRPPRDKNNQQLMLPAISIRRTGIEQTSEDITGRGMNQATGDIVIKRRLAQDDRNYQNLINKLALPNLDPTKFPGTKRQTGEDNPNVNWGTHQGSLLSPNLGNNIWELISIPQPQFYTATYELIFWTTHTLHMNYLITTLFSSFLPQGKMFKLNTPKGYWFMAYVDDNLTSQENFDDFTDQKRILKWTFQIKVKAFILASAGPGVPVPIRRTISAPFISFDMIDVPGPVISRTQNPDPGNKDFALREINQDPATAQTPRTNERLLVQKDVYDPNSGKFVKKYARILDTNQRQGETVYYAQGFTSLEDFLDTLKSGK